MKPRGPKPNGNELIYPNVTTRFQDKKTIRWQRAWYI